MHFCCVDFSFFCDFVYSFLLLTKSTEITSFFMVSFEQICTNVSLATRKYVSTHQNNRWISISRMCINKGKKKSQRIRRSYIFFHSSTLVYFSFTLTLNAQFIQFDVYSGASVCMFVQCIFLLSSQLLFSFIFIHMNIYIYFYCYDYEWFSFMGFR